MTPRKLILIYSVQLLKSKLKSTCKNLYFSSKEKSQNKTFAERGEAQYSGEGLTDF